MLVVCVAVLVVACMTVTTAMAYTAGSLPGGTSIEVDNVAPADGDTFYIPIGETTIDITDTGTASIGEGVAVADTTLIYVLDASGSTAEASGGTCGEQQTHDLESGPDEIIDCEILAAINLNDVAISLGSVDEVAMIIFAGSAVTADATPDFFGDDDAIIDPAADANATLTNDVNELLQSIKVAEYASEESGFPLFTDKPTADIYGTNFGAGIAAALDVAALATNPNVIVVFMSDGYNSKGVDVDTFDYGDVVFYTFAIGSGSDCNTDQGLGSLSDIATLSGGECYEIPDPSDLPDILPELIGSTLDSLQIEVDGGGMYAIGNAAIDPDLPQDGPATVAYSTTVTGLGAGDHEICVTASGTDVGGSGNVTDCKTITVIQLIDIDIKPWSDPNSINLKSKGVIPVAILTTDEFDAATVDPDTVLFAGAAPVHYAMEDVDNDGDMDMILHFNTQETDIIPGETEATLTGETFDGAPISGTDSLRTIPKWT